MNERGAKPEHVEGPLERFLRSRGLMEGVERASILLHWSDLVGPEIARVAQPKGFDDGTLFVEVRSSAWLMELRMMQRRLLARLNEDRRRRVFEKIVFRLAEGA